MRRLRRPVLAIVLAFGAFVVGSGVAALPTTTNESCFDVGLRRAPPPSEELVKETRGSTEWAPYGMRCEVIVDENTTIVESRAPSFGAFVAWLVLCAALLVLALRRPDSAAARGAVLAAALLGLLGGLHQQTEYPAAGMGMLLLGAPLTYALDRVLRARPRGTDRVRSVALAIALPLIVLTFWTVPDFMALSVPAIFSGVAAGALTSWLVAWPFRARAVVQPT